MVGSRMAFSPLSTFFSVARRISCGGIICFFAVQKDQSPVCQDCLKRYGFDFDILRFQNFGFVFVKIRIRHATTL